MLLKKTFEILMYLFIVTVTLIPFEKITYGIPLSANLILGSCAIIVGTLYIIKNYKSIKDKLYLYNDNKLKIFFIIIFAYTALGLISVIYAKNKACVINEAERFLEYVALFYLVIVIGDEKFIKRSFYLFYIAMIIASIYGVAQYVFNFSTFHSKEVPFHRGRVYSTFVNPNYWGAAVNMIIYYPFLKAIQRDNKHRIIDISIFLLFFANLLLTFTRGSWIGFIIGLVILTVIYYKKILYVLILGIASVFMVPSIRHRFLLTFDMNYLTNRERFTLWKTGYLMFKEHFLTGVGNGNYLDMYRIYIRKYPELYLNREQYTVHNSYLRSFAELGIFGGILFTALYNFMFYLSYVFYKNIKEKNYKIIALTFVASWSTYIFQNFFNNLIFIPQMNVLVWVAMGLICKCYLMQKDK